MLVYMYQASLYCSHCGTLVQADLESQGLAPNNPEDERTFDSDRYPKGLYEAGESDSPDFCYMCGTFLQNPLTSDGNKYVLEHWDGWGQEVRDFYDYLKPASYYKIVGEIVRGNHKKAHDNSLVFKRLFNRNLKDYMDSITGFDIIKFDEDIETPDGISTHDFILKTYGQEAVDLVHSLI